MKCNYVLLFIFINVLKQVYMKQFYTTRVKQFSYISPFSARAYISNPVIDADKFNFHMKYVTENQNYYKEETKYGVGYHTVTPELTIIKDGKLTSGQSKECAQNCQECLNGTCNKCSKGTFVYGNACYESCPLETLADNTSLECKLKKDLPIYIKAYTVSRCVNSCGKVFQDCSCNPRCKKSGDCCSDFQFCEIVEDSHTTETKIENCKFSSIDKSICLQCKDNFYYYNNLCLLHCPNNSFPNEDNKICLDNNKCPVKYCEKCSDNNCIKCNNGYYLLNGQCFKSCPVGMRANRINYTCQSKSEFSFYWIFPSKYGCKNKCGDHNIQSDCSCRHTCLRRGNCCDDFEKECKEELKKEDCKLCSNCINGKCAKCKENSELLVNNENNCQCKEGFIYDIEEDLCHKEIPKDYLVKKEEKFNNTNNSFMQEKKPANLSAKISDIETGHNTQNLLNKKEEPQTSSITNPSYVLKSTIQPQDSWNSSLANYLSYESKLDNTDTYNPQFYNKSTPLPKHNNQIFNNNNMNNITKNDENSIINKALSEELLKSFKNMFSMQNPMNKNQILNLYMNGNISINVLTGNTNPQLITQNIYNNNSFNTHTEKLENIDSNNKIIKNRENPIPPDNNQAKLKTNKLLNKRKSDLKLASEKTHSNKLEQLNNVIRIEHEKNFNKEDVGTNHQLFNSNENKELSEINAQGLNNTNNQGIISQKSSNLGKKYFTKNDTNLTEFLKDKKDQLNNTNNPVSPTFINNQFGFDIHNETGNNFNNDNKNKDKYHVQNNYYINDQSIKVLNSKNPSIISFCKGNQSNYNPNNSTVSREVIVINNNMDNKQNQNSSIKGESIIIVNNNKKSRIKN